MWVEAERVYEEIYGSYDERGWKIKSKRLKKLLDNIILTQITKQ